MFEWWLLMDVAYVCKNAYLEQRMDCLDIVLSAVTCWNSVKNYSL